MLSKISAPVPQAKERSTATHDQTGSSTWWTAAFRRCVPLRAGTHHQGDV